MSRGLPSSVRPMMVVWGEAYTQLLTELSLPALLAEGNLPVLAREFPCIFRIHTTPADAARIRQSPAYARLTSMMPTEFVPLDRAAHANKYEAMSAAHGGEMRASLADNAASIFLSPDSIWADGSLAAVGRALRTGRRAVFQAGLRVTADTAIPLIRSRYSREPIVAMSIPARELVRLALDHMHPTFRGFYWDASDFNVQASNFYWRAGNDGMVIRGFHLHPLMMFPSRDVQAFICPIDDALPQLALAKYGDAWVVQDSDEVFHVDVMRAEDAGQVTGETAAVRHLITFAHFATNQFHRWLFTQPIRIHTGRFSTAWPTAERASAGVARAFRVRFFLSGLRLWVPALVFGMTRRRLTERSARQGLGWHLLSRQAETLDDYRRDVFVRLAVATFGVTVVARALGLDANEVWWRHVERGLLLRRWFRETHLALAPAADARRRLSEPWGSRNLRPPRGKLPQFLVAFLAVRWVAFTAAIAAARRWPLARTRATRIH
jgi:hypothetical protein